MKKLLMLMASVVLVSGLTACGPAEIPPIVEIAPNETAFLVPMEGATKEGQAQFGSLAYLESNKVAAKRVELPIRKRTTGRGPGAFEWIPTMKVIKVDRTPVTREWTDDGATGTTNRNEGFRVESADSIGFVLGGTLTARVTEEDAATFLYHYAGKPLSQVVDQNVRGYLQAYLTDAFGRLQLAKCKEQKGDIFKNAEAAAKAKYKELGVTIDTFGPSQGLAYSNRAIQDAIDAAYKAEMLITQRENEKAAQDKDNERIRAAAETKLYEAQQFAAAEKAATKMIGLEIDRIKANAALEMARKWNGQLPEKILPSDSPLLMSIQ